MLLPFLFMRNDKSEPSKPEFDLPILSTFKNPTGPSATSRQTRDSNTRSPLPTSKRSPIRSPGNFRAQFDRAGLVIDERFQSGGQLADRFLSSLARETFVHLALPHGLDRPWRRTSGWSGLSRRPYASCGKSRSPPHRDPGSSAEAAGAGGEGADQTLPSRVDGLTAVLKPATLPSATSEISVFVPSRARRFRNLYSPKTYDPG